MTDQGVKVSATPEERALRAAEHTRLALVPFAPRETEAQRMRDYAKPIAAEIRSASEAARKEALRQAEELAHRWAKRCPYHGEKHFCDEFGCQSFTDLAAAIRSLSSRGPEQEGR